MMKQRCLQLLEYQDIPCRRVLVRNHAERFDERNNVPINVDAVGTILVDESLNVGRKSGTLRR